MNTSDNRPESPFDRAIELTGGWRVQSAPLTPDNAPTEPSTENQEPRTLTGHISSVNANPIPHPSSLSPEHSIPDSTHLQPILYPDQPYWGERVRAVNQQAWIYQRTFDQPGGAFKRARLRFEAVDYFADVWLNDVFVGRHEGHFAPFDLDVTAHLRPGAQTLTLRVSSPWDAPNPAGTYPTDHVVRGLVKGLYEHGEGVIPPDVNPIGIWRPVWLLLDQGISIDHVRIVTELNGRVTLNLRIANQTGATWHGQLALDVSADNHTGEGVTDRRSLTLPPGEHTVEHVLQVPDPHLWWSWDQGAPDLYQLEARLLDGDQQIVSARREGFGIRTVRLERTPRRFTYWLNERPVFIRGASYMPALYLSDATPDLIARDLALAREAHLNLLRLHVHVSPREVYDQCDRAGMLVWQDFELNWIHDSSPGFEARARRLQREMIDLLGNHPSIMTWACHNEPTMVYARRHNLEQHPDPALYADARQQDPTRPVFICSGQREDDWRRSGDSHSYYGAIWSPRYTDIRRHRTKLNTEFGFETPAALATLREYADVWARLDHVEDQIEALWAYQAALIQYHVEHFRRLRRRGCAGFVHFWLVDLVPQVGCGVLDACRLPKGGYAALQRASQPVHVALDHDGRRAKALWIFNDTPRAFPAARVVWQVEDGAGRTLVEGETTFDVTANASQRVMPLRWSAAPDACARIHLRLVQADGELLSENEYDRPFQPLRRPRGYPWKFDPYLGTKVFDRDDAPSLADQSGSPVFRRVPLWIREAGTERILRQHIPSPLVSSIARLVDAVIK